VPARPPDPARLHAILAEQRAALGPPASPEPGAPAAVPALQQDILVAVLAAVDAGTEPLRPALRVTTQYLLDLLAARAPGRAVEVRIPPFAAVQCIEGPRHTRGTPANVVETDPLTWLRLATGRLDWPAAAANGALRASGPRSDISAWLPLAGPGGGLRAAPPR